MEPRASHTHSIHRAVVRNLAALIAGVTALLPAGCSFIPGCGPDPGPFVFETMPTKYELVDYLNRRSSQLSAWRSTDATVSTRGPIGLPIRLSAMISVERPRNFRLVARSALDHEADFGSNDERFWFWMRQSEVKRVFTIRHADLHKVRGRLPIPFRPDWVMESLGVIPLNAEAITMTPGEEGTTTVRFVSEDTTPSGRTIRRVIVVDYRAGQVTRQSLFDGRGQEIARAEFSNFRQTANGGLILPHRIDLAWPKAKAEMTLSLGTIDVNPPNVDPSLFALPKIEGYPVWQMGSRVVGNQLRRNSLPIVPRAQPRDRQPPGRVRIGPDDASAGPQLDRSIRRKPPQFEEDVSGQPQAVPERTIQTGYEPPGDAGSPKPFPAATRRSAPKFVDD